MAELTKEWLQQAINDYESVRDELPFGLDDYQWNILAALRIALASLELERGMIRRFDLDMSGCDSFGQDCGADMVEDLDGEYVLWDEVLPYLYRYNEYTATPAQVSVPEVVGWEDVPEEITEDDINLASAWAHGFNQCRAAMLQGDEPVTDNTNQQFESLSRGDK